MTASYKLLIGSVGDDSHSIGMTLLKIAFRENGFTVKNIGILNALDDFFHIAHNFEAILISCVNGHADLYLDDFPNKLNAFRLGNSKQILWYIGGNLSVKESNETVIRKFLHMGFDFVSPKPISFKNIHEQMLKDFHNKGIKPTTVDYQIPSDYPDIDLASVNDNPMDEKSFDTIRKQVLLSWPTGAEVHNADITRNHIYPHKNLHKLILRNRAKSTKPLIQPRTGVAHTTDEIDILQHLHANGLDVSSIQLDAASRKNLYEKAAEGVTRSTAGKTSLLNGYPVPVHGVKGIKTIIESIDTPFQIRAGSPDHRFVYEVGLAGGASSLEGGFICYLFPYDKTTSPLESLQFWKYVDRLSASYFKYYQAVINREYFGPLTCCLIEPSLPITINIVQAILSAKAGVKCISVGLAEQGNRIQDIAAHNVLRTKTLQYLSSMAYADVTISTVYHQYMAAFPTDYSKARDIIYNSSVTAALAQADRIMTKTPVESIHIPTKMDNAEGLNLTSSGINQAYDVHIDRLKIEQEIALLEEEVDGLMKYVFTAGKGSFARGALIAFKEGVLDIPFSPSKYNRGQLLTAKDCDGAIRFINPEILPFSEKVKDIHREKIQKRMSTQRTSQIFEVLEHDLTRIWKNDFKQWPLDGHYII